MFLPWLRCFSTHPGLLFHFGSVSSCFGIITENFGSIYLSQCFSQYLLISKEVVSVTLEMCRIPPKKVSVLGLEVNARGLMRLMLLATCSMMTWLIPMLLLSVSAMMRCLLLFPEPVCKEFVDAWLSLFWSLGSYSLLDSTQKSTCSVWAGILVVPYPQY